MHRIEVPGKFKVPLIIKETLGEEAYNQMQEAIDNIPPKECMMVIYCNDVFAEKLRDATIKGFEKYLQTKLKE